MEEITNTETDSLHHQRNDPPTEVVIGTCLGCGSLSINPLSSEGCCEGVPGLTRILYVVTDRDPDDDIMSSMPDHLP